MIPRTVFARFALVSLVVLCLDLAGKQVAATLLGGLGEVPLGSRFSLLLVYNTGNAGGGTLGPFTWHVNVALTAVAVFLMTSVVAPLAQVDRRAITALGAVTGGAMGNLASLLFGPPGVADFLGIQLSADTMIVVNLADLALWTGALLLMPVALSVVRALREESRRPLAVTPRPAQNPM
ncbi:MAG: signal peptidase II [Gemmatimonadetes bacterium]|nr:signal peptidase II [Gemmatimonadota bacterium]